VAGLVIIALDTLALQAVRMLATVTAAEFIYIGIILFAWFLILLGTDSIKRLHAAFARAMICAAVMMAVTFIELMIAYHNYAIELGEEAFIQFNVMLANYITIMGLFYTYYSMLQGAEVVARIEKANKLSAKCAGRGRLCFAGIIACYVVIPIAGMFDPIVDYILTGVLGITALLLQLWMCFLLLCVYDLIKGGKEVEDEV
jgi:hypothetical protein